MQKGNLTFKEFWKLSEEERSERYVELSDHDKFRVRLSMNPGVRGVPCNSCVHNLGYGKCKAYPEGISREHIDLIDKDLNIMCGDGFRYTALGDGESLGLNTHHPDYPEYARKLQAIWDEQNEEMAQCPFLGEGRPNKPKTDILYRTTQKLNALDKEYAHILHFVLHHVCPLFQKRIDECYCWRISHIGGDGILDKDDTVSDWDSTKRICKECRHYKDDISTKS